MKAKTLLCVLLLLAGSAAFAQDTVLMQNALTRSVTEQYSVLKANKKLKQGEYMAYTKTGIVARGRYDKGKRIGEWIFGSDRGKLMQVYNYDSSKVVSNDTRMMPAEYSYTPEPFLEDKVTKPIKIGGYYYGLMTLMFNPDQATTIHFDFSGEDKLVMEHIFTISATGDLIKHEVHVKTDSREKTYLSKDRDLDAYIKQFVPAMINGKPVACKMTVSETMTFGLTQADALRKMKGN